MSLSAQVDGTSTRPRNHRAVHCRSQVLPTAHPTPQGNCHRLLAQPAALFFLKKKIYFYFICAHVLLACM